MELKKAMLQLAQCEKKKHMRKLFYIEEKMGAFGTEPGRINEAVTNLYQKIAEDYKKVALFLE